MADAPGNLVELYRARGLPEAHALRAALEAAGIAVRVENEYLQGAVGDLPLGWSTAPRLLVPRADEIAARACLDEFLRPAEPTADDYCLACRAPLGNAAVCPACGWSYAADSDAIDEPGPPAEPTPDPVEPTPTAPRSLPVPVGPGGWGEVAVVLAVGVIPFLADALVILHTPGRPLPYWLDCLYSAVLSGCPLFVVMYLIRRGGEPWDRFGVDAPRFTDLLFGMAFLVVAEMLVYLRVAVLPLPETPIGGGYPRPRGGLDYTLMLVKYTVGACSEELITRAYLITRLKDLLGSVPKAVLAAAAAFASYHLYQGWTGTIDVFVFGVVYGVAYLLIGRLWPLVVGHALFNIRLDLMTV
jgi:membrane protease YdiL (CAAX protease family)